MPSIVDVDSRLLKFFLDWQTNFFTRVTTVCQLSF